MLRPESRCLCIKAVQFYYLEFVLNLATGVTSLRYKFYWRNFLIAINFLTR